MNFFTIARSRSLSLILLVMFAALQACGGGGGGSDASDTTNPIITINGENPLTVIQTDTYVEAGATATDNIDKNITATSSNSVDTYVLGTHFVTYSATDAAGNTGVATRTVNVVPDTEPPVVLLNGEASLTLVRTTPYVEAGATVTDNANNNLTIITAGSVDANTIGTYVLTYSATDVSGNTGVATRTVNVVPDTIPPVVILNGANSLTIVRAGTYLEAGATATDNIDGSITATPSGSVNTGSIGTYIVTYSATDTAGNTGTTTRTVNIVAPPRPFITKWQTNNRNGVGGYVATNDNQIKITTTGSGYNYQVNWGDGQSDSNVTGDIIHTYANIGVYTVTISGDFPRIYFSDPGSLNYDNYKLLSVEQWGDNKWQSMYSAFYYCQNLRINAQDAPDLSQVSDMAGMFYSATSLNDDLNTWDVSSVTSMASMFMFASAFNGDISSWDVSSVTSMRAMFWYASAFNQSLGSWDVSSVTDMTYLFSDATVFNQNLNGWDVSSVTEMSYLFRNAHAFNQDISSWDVSSVPRMNAVFESALAFNQDISSWDVSSVLSMTGLFRAALAFNQDISSWDVSSVVEMRDMFVNAYAFNQDISQWDVSSVSNMQSMFAGARAFNQNISAWDVSSVTDMRSMFAYTRAFNQSLSAWDVSSVTDMSHMFSWATAFNGSLDLWDVSSVTNMMWMFREASVFDRALNSWNVSSVTNMDRMFRNATNFDQDLSNWDVSSVWDMTRMFAGATSFNQNIGGWDVSTTNMSGMFNYGAGLSTSNYDALLLGWSAQSLPNGAVFAAGTSKYSSAAQAARDVLTNTYNWTVTDFGLAP